MIGYCAGQSVKVQQMVGVDQVRWSYSTGSYRTRGLASMMDNIVDGKMYNIF